MEDQPHQWSDQYERAQVIETYKEASGTTQIRVKVLSGDDKNSQQVIEAGPSSIFAIGGEREVHKGQTVVVDKNTLDGNVTWSVIDQYRLTSLVTIILLFFALVLLVAKKRGLGAIIGLAVTVAILMGFALPQLVHGASPFPTLLISAVAIASTSLYLAHGLNRRTHVATVSTLLTLGLAPVVGWGMMHLAHVYGLGDEAGFYLQQTPLGNIDLRGLFLGGILIGAIGVLDDVTTGQSSVVDELVKANPSLGFGELFRRGMSVGTEHIASLVNTLFLAYAGVSMPLFLLAQVNATQPSWTFVNSEFVAEEVVRTLAGSVTLILAVPITTIIAAWWFHLKARPVDAKRLYGVDNATKLR